VLSESGVVGTLLFGGFLGLTLLTVVRIPASPRRELAGVLAAAAGVWLLHGLVDWLWEMPALGALGILLLAAGCGLAPRRPASSRPRRRFLRYVAAGCGAVLVVALAATLVFPWIAERDVRRAASLWRVNPSAAFSILSQAHDLNPLSNEADLVSLTGKRALAAASLRRAALLNPADPIVRSVEATFNAGRRIDSDRVDRAFANQS
jgi:hypothetical protein